MMAADLEDGQELTFSSITLLGRKLICLLAAPTGLVMEGNFQNWVLINL